MLEFIQKIFPTSDIKGVTINWVSAPEGLIVLLYATIAVIFLVQVAIKLRKKAQSAIRFAFISAFLTSALIYVVFADNLWLHWLSKDLQRFAGLSSEKKLLRLDGHLYGFASEVKLLKLQRYRLFHTLPPDSYLQLRLEYFLLPATKSDDAEHVIVLGEQAKFFEHSTGKLILPSAKLADATLVLRYAHDATVYRVAK